MVELSRNHRNIATYIYIYVCSTACKGLVEVGRGDRKTQGYRYRRRYENRISLPHWAVSPLLRLLVPAGGRLDLAIAAYCFSLISRVDMRQMSL